MATAVVATGTPSADAVTVIVPGGIPDTGRITARALPRHTALVFCRSEDRSDGSPLPTASSSPGPVTEKVTTGANCDRARPTAGKHERVSHTLYQWQPQGFYLRGRRGTLLFFL